MIILVQIADSITTVPQHATGGTRAHRLKTAGVDRGLTNTTQPQYKSQWRSNGSAATFYMSNSSSPNPLHRKSLRADEYVASGHCVNREKMKKKRISNLSP